ncbi:MAG: transporter substrate-binding domain-containing protein [Clostridia bacterium]|nr:transporter substrate-binding domain-containing protein [Clostridia bacterium]
MKKIIALLLVAVLAVALVSCGGENADVVTMGTNAAFEPFEFIEGDEIVGIDAEIGATIAEKLGKDLKINDMEFESLLGALKTDKVDFVAAGMTANDERRKEVDFSDTYYTATQGIIVAEDSDIKGIDDILDKRVGAITGYTGEVICTETYKIKDMLTFKRGVDAVMELKNGKLDAVVIDLQPAKMFVDKNEGLKVIEDPSFEAEEYAIAIKKGNTELLEKVNEVIAELKETGKLDEIINKYQNK